METVRRAVVDVGTNSIKLLVADVSGGEVMPVLEESKQTRLGKGFYESHRLQPEAIARTAEAVARFATIAKEHQAQNIRVIATSAARDAVNGAELVRAIRASSGSAVEIISGEQEADWVFRGVTSDPGLGEGSLLLLDVGGGSSEFIVGLENKKLFAGSFPLGAVRLVEQVPHSDPPTALELSASRARLKELLTKEIEPKVAPALRRASEGARGLPAKLVGTGGTATILARMEARLEDYHREKIEATRLSFERLQWHVRRLWKMPLEERKQIVGLPKNRADIILTGALIYEEVMRHFQFSELHVSTRGLRFAAVMESPV